MLLGEEEQDRGQLGGTGKMRSASVFAGKQLQSDVGQLMDRWTHVWEQALTAIRSLGTEWEDTRHLQEQCPPWSLPQSAVFRLSQSSALSGISAGVA